MAVVKWPGLQQYDAEMKQYIATHYEPKLLFDPTPIYNATLAEDVQATASDPYLIQLPNVVPEIWIEMKTPVTNMSDTVDGFFTDTEDNTSSKFKVGSVYSSTNSRRVLFHCFFNNGIAIIEYGLIGAGLTYYALNVTQPFANGVAPVIGSGNVASFSIYTPTSGIIPAGTVFTIYAA